VRLAVGRLGLLWRACSVGRKPRSGLVNCGRADVRPAASAGDMSAVGQSA